MKHKFKNGDEVIFKRWGVIGTILKFEKEKKVYVCNFLELNWLAFFWRCKEEEIVLATKVSKLLYAK